MSKKLKEFRITCKIEWAEVEITLNAKDEAAARAAATESIESGEADINWGSEGQGVVRIDSISNMTVTEEKED